MRKTVSRTREPRVNRDCLRWLKRVAVIFVVGVCCALAADQDIILVGSGSSVPLPLYGKWGHLYNQKKKAIHFQSLPQGTSEGINQVTRGVSDFGAGETPLTAEERRQANLTELPVVLIGIVPIYNLPGNPQLRLSGEVLADVYLGHVKNWNDAAMVKLNPGITLPSLPIRVINRPAGKGSNYVFTDFLSKASVRFRNQIGRSPSPKWPVGEPAERRSDMADKVKKNPGALGYVELQYADDNHITHASVLNASGKFVKGTAASITAACAAVEAPGWDKLAASLTNAPGANSYPIASFTWVYVRSNAKDSRRTKALVDLLNWGYTEGQRVAVQEDYSELPKTLVAKITVMVNAMK